MAVQRKTEQRENAEEETQAQDKRQKHIKSATIWQLHSPDFSTIIKVHVSADVIFQARGGVICH